jgi:uncharacterized protein YbjT (DUF2867 family)
MILVAGATGLLGGHITNRLLDASTPTAILVREGSDYSRLAGRGARARIGDLRDPASLTRACAGVDVVISTANSAARGGEDNVDSVEIQGNRNLIDAAARAGARRFVFISALGADLESPVPFLRGKALAEQHLRKSGMEWTILQPNIFLEIWAGMLVAAPLIAGHPVQVIGDGNQRHSMISVADVAAFAVAAADHPGARNRVIALGGPEPLSWRDVAARFETVTGRPVEFRTIPIGQPLPGLPDVVTGLATSLATFESPIPMEETAREFGVRLTPVETVIRQIMPPAELEPMTSA